MGFEYNYGCADAAKTLNAAIKFNQGAWKSTKQRSFMDSKILKTADACYPLDNENTKTFFGVEVTGDQKAVLIEGFARFCDYGSRGTRPVAWMYVLDEVGVVAQYKLKFQGTLRTGVSVVPEKTTCLWTRPAGVYAPVEPIVEPKPELQYIGTVGERVTMRLHQVYFINKGPSAFSYYGSDLFTIFKDENDNIVYYNNFPTGVSQEQAQNGIEVTFTVKKHIENKKGEKVTTASRMTLTKGQKLLLSLGA